MSITSDQPPYFAKPIYLALVEDRSSSAGKFPFRQVNELDKRPDQEEDDKDEDSSNDDGDLEE